ncbi:hypothetical protein [Flavobacterium caseinilyticum]|uniref:Uncharacterized protein n=1 Tax=Flavobacterium caseinilyticum TaxID=2541732 RepID=A0A4R5ANU0_9FLAO|nr:hypothetical protein [Flavobacterium caseinilyticum]TDD74658.1 hypothetical protein E0F89_14230 [Flavobacterium caseinilyticum]
MQNDTISNYDFILQLGEEAKIIYKDMISFIPTSEEQFDTLFTGYFEDTFIKDPYYSKVLDHLSNLGTHKVLFIKESNLEPLNIKANQNSNY